MSLFYDEIEIEDLDYNEENQIYTYPCPCGDIFKISQQEIDNGEDIAHCETCTLILRVIYKSKNNTNYERETIYN